MFNKIRKGFTLVELLVVMGVLAVLAGALVVLLDPAERLKLATDTKAIADATQILSSMQSYTAQSGGLYYNPGVATNSWTSMTAKLKDDGFISVTPPSVSGNYTFGYYYDNTTKAAKLNTTLTSKKFRGTSTTGCWCWSSTDGSSKDYAQACRDITTSATCQ